ncbi:MAG: tetratricopeptide repeat protein [Bacteroidota bacterium]
MYMRKMVFQALCGFCLSLIFDGNVRAQSTSASSTEADSHSPGLTLHNLAADFARAGQFDSADHYFARAITTLEQAKDNPRLINAMRGYGVLHLSTGNWQAAQENLLRAQALARRHDIEAYNHKIQLDLGQLNMMLSDYPRGIRHALQAIRLSQDKPSFRMGAYNVLANLYDLDENPDAAEAILKQALGQLDQVGDSIAEKSRARLRSTFYLTLGVLEREAGHPHAAITYQHKALAAAKSIDLMPAIINARINLAYAHMHARDDALATAILDSLEAEATEMSISRVVMRIGFMRAEHDLLRGRYAASLKGLEATARDFPEGKTPEVRLEIFKQKVKIFEGGGRFEQALAAERSREALQDSLIGREQARKIERVQAEFEFAQAQAADSLAWEQKLAVQALESLKVQHRQERTILWLVLGLVAATGLVVGLVFYSRYRRQRTRLALAQQAFENQQLEAELQHRHKELSSLTLQLLNKNQLLDELKENLRTARHGRPETSQVALQQAEQLLKSSKRIDQDWGHFQRCFEGVHAEFLTGMKRDFPGLTPHELRVLTMMKVNLDTHQMASVLGISPDSVKKARYRIRKKMELPEGQRLADFVLAYGN